MADNIYILLTIIISLLLLTCLNEEKNDFYREQTTEFCRHF